LRELLGHRRQLGLSQLKSAEQCNLLDVGAGKSHESQRL
jgi:hypothetical protein